MPTDLQIQIATDRIVLKRGPRMMVLFRGCPLPKEIEPLREAAVAIGLALSSSELRAVSSLDTYRYVFVSTGRRARRPVLAEAVTDLGRSGWSIDVDSDDTAAKLRRSRDQWSGSRPSRQRFGGEDRSLTITTGMP